MPGAVEERKLVDRGLPCGHVEVDGLVECFDALDRHRRASRGPLEAVEVAGSAVDDAEQVAGVADRPGQGGRQQVEGGLKVVEQLQGILVVTADHGNADEMFQRDKHGKVQRDKKSGVPIAKTSHTLNAVPFLIHDPTRGDRYEIDPDRAATAGIANVTATCLELLGLEPPDDLEPSILRFR